MRVLIIGGTGLISVGIVKHLLARRAEVTVFNRGQRDPTPTGVQVLVGDRNAADFESRFARSEYDVVIDMICFSPAQAESSIRAFAGRCRHFVFCSTVCTYGTKVPPQVLVDETFAQQPISNYGKGKLACERLFKAAHERGDFAVTIIRPSHTYGPGSSLVDQLEFDAVAWDRIERGLPVLISDGGLGLWQSTHRDDCGKLFAYACLTAKTYGQDYNATRDQVFTWRDYYRHVAQTLGRPAHLVSMPAEWIVSRDPSRFGGLNEIFRHHGAYCSAKARRDVPEFRCAIDFPAGAAETLADVRRRGAWRDSRNDALYQGMIDTAIAIGVKPVEA